MSETMSKQRKMFTKVRQRQDEEWQATKNQFHKSLSRIRESFNRGKDLIQDDLQEMEICVKEIKQARRKYNIKNDLVKMNEPDYDSDLSSFDKQFFSSSGRFNINQIKSSLKQYNESQPLENEKFNNTTNEHLSTLLKKQPFLENWSKKSKNIDDCNKTWELVASSEIIPSIAKQAMTKTSLTKMLDWYSDSMIDNSNLQFNYTDKIQKLRSSHKTQQEKDKSINENVRE